MNSRESLILNKEMYSKEVILFAIKQYQELSMIKILDRGKYWECLFSNCCYNKKITMMEFENYLINIINVKN